MAAEFFMGLDLGQAADPTAITVVQRWEDPDEQGRLQGHYDLRHLDRLPLNTGYPRVVEHVALLMERAPIRGKTALVVDATGVGRPVVDMLRAAKLRPVPVVVHGGAETVRDANGFVRTPKRELVSLAQVLLQSGRLKFAPGLPLVKTLVDELLRFEVKITESGNDTYGAWRERARTTTWCSPSAWPAGRASSTPPRCARPAGVTSSSSAVTTSLRAEEVRRVGRARLASLFESRHAGEVRYLALLCRHGHEAAPWPVGKRRAS